MRANTVSVLACIVAGLGGASAAADHPLIGRWEREGAVGGWMGPLWIAFDAEHMHTDALGTFAIREVTLDDDLVRVSTRFGETYTFEIIDADRICLPEAQMHALSDEPEAPDPLGRICYVRT